MGTSLQAERKLAEAVAGSWIVNTIINVDLAIVEVESGRRIGLAPRLQPDKGDDFRMESGDDGNRSISSPMIPSI